MTTVQAATTTADLIRELERLPARPSAAVRVLWMVDDPNASAADLAAAVSTDPSLTARVMRMANASYYGLSGRVSSAAFAITVLGFDTVRALAAAAAAGLGSTPYPLPADFLNRAATVAVAAALTAPRVAARRPEAYSLGLLHNIGSGLLYRSDPSGYTAVVALAERGGDLSELERERYGIDAADIGVRVLSAWRFPEEFVEAVGAQRLPAEGIRSPMGKALVSGVALADLAQPDAGERGITGSHSDPALEGIDPRRVAALAAANISGDTVWALAAQVRRESAGLAAALAAA